ncbi:putative ABC transport system ATP-binding protein [Kineothrix alysoides]|uniref:Putative ABC transport system ATP-binding protein n=1 Tax=Kineothrix alysoides TaxID=1469948 RepID=A0A4R1QVR3_9FIRM|nr:ABC transporter ATP-binding protein [Kineothrix alysoides]TCL57687.1 putative ABC transport system ATP-binding protein [Kineothrix alysoides]
MSEILKTVNISKKFNSFETALKEVSLTFKSGMFHVILGQSGSGKSTLINIMSSLLKPTSGKIFYGEEEITNLSKKERLILRHEKFSNIFQEYFLLSELTVKENIELGKSAQDKNISYEEIMQHLDIVHLDKRFPYELSGGQRQRAAIARAIIKNPDVLFCDEATGALDEENSKKIVSYLKEINKKYGTTIIFSTHNIKISKMADRIITMKDGAVISDIQNRTPTLVQDIDWGI